MSTRRSPRLKGLSPKPELPPKPRPPKRVKDVLANSVREANFQVELAAWEAAKEEHDNLMKKRKTKQKAAGRAAGKSAAEAEAPPPAAPPAALAPPPQLSADEARCSSARPRWLSAGRSKYSRRRKSGFRGCGAAWRGGRSTSRRWRCVVELAELKFSTTTVCGSISRSMEV